MKADITQFTPMHFAMANCCPPKLDHYYLVLMATADGKEVQCDVAYLDDECGWNFHDDLSGKWLVTHWATTPGTKRDIEAVCVALDAFAKRQRDSLIALVEKTYTDMPTE